MRIAVVDDNAADRAWLAEQMEALLSRRRMEGSVVSFSGGERFLAQARRERFDLAFLDIYMEGTDGLKAARLLREFDRECLLVFSTSSPDHALEGYRVRASQYLVKPYRAAELEEIFDHLGRLLPAQEKYIELRAGRQAVRVRLRDILWAEHFRHRICIHLDGGGEVASRLTFGAFAALLSGEDRFFICGRGVLVNLDHAADFDGRAFRLEGGGSVPVTRDLSGAARTAFGDRLFQMERGPCT